MDYRSKIQSNSPSYGSRRGGSSLRPRSQDDRSERRRRRSPATRKRRDDQRLLTNFRTTLAKTPPPLPPSLLRAINTREVPALGKVRIILRETPTVACERNEKDLLIFDKKRRQVTLQEPRTTVVDPHLGVSAPKIFAFDQVFSKDEDQKSVVNATVPDILQAVLAGHDGCIMSFGACDTGKTYTMVGAHTPPSQLGVIPSAISWLYRTIGELKNTSGTRFSVRVSAVTVDPSGKLLTDVLSAHSQDNETSPGVLLRDVNNGVLSAFAELRASTPETAARYFDLALSARAHQRIHSSGAYLPSSTLLFSLHVYQYSVDKSGKGGVVGGRSRLHLIDLGDMSARVPNSISLSRLNAVLLSLFNGQKYLPHRENKLVHLLQDTIGSLTCYATIIVNVSPSLSQIQHTLATLQLSSRIHRFRRKKFRGFGGSGSGSSEGSKRRSSGEDNSAGSSSMDFSSSEQSADTVIYLGGGGPGDSSDGEHPPVFLSHHVRHGPSGLPRLRSLEHLRPHTASPITNSGRRPASASPTPSSRSVPMELRTKPTPPPRAPSQTSPHSGSPQPNNFFRHQPGLSQVVYPNQQPLLSSFKPNGPASIPSPTGRPKINYSVYQEPNNLVPVYNGNNTPQSAGPVFHKQAYTPQPVHIKYDNKSLNPIKSPEQKSIQTPSDEQWIDGPKISKSKLPVRAGPSQGETWVDGPTTKSYGYMDDHKKTMIQKWVEHQTAQVSNSPTPSHVSNPPLPTEVEAKPEDEMPMESDVDTISEPTHASNGHQPNIIEELERKNLIPADTTESKPPTKQEDPSIEDICSQCEALAEECEELNSLLSCEEEACKTPTRHGLATVVEEPELESTLGADEPSDGVSLLNNPQTDCEDIETIDLPSSELSTPKQLHGRSTIDSGIQVCQEDITRSMCVTPCQSEATLEGRDDHPLRVLSEENLTCASNFTDIHSTLEDSMDEHDFENHNLNSVEIPEYNQLRQRLDPSYLQHLMRLDRGNKADLQNIFKAMAYNQTPSINKTPIPSLSQHVQMNYVTCSTCGLETDKINGNGLHNVSMDKCIGTDDTSSKCSCGQKRLMYSTPRFYSSQLQTEPSRQDSTPTNIDITNANPPPESYKIQSVPRFTETIEASVIYPFLDNRYDCNNYNRPQEKDNDSDCGSTISDDSEYGLHQSKFSKFLCVGIRRSKSKGSIKKSTKNEVKRHKSKESQRTQKSRDNSASPKHESKNLKKSPSQFAPLNLDKPVQSQQCVAEPIATHVSYEGGFYDSGQDSPNIQDVPTPEEPSMWQPKPASVVPKTSSAMSKLNHSTATSNSLGTTQSLGESSGYESIPRDSECSSFSSSQESEIDDEHRKESRFNVIRRLCTRSKSVHQGESWTDKGRKTHDPRKIIKNSANQPMVRTVSASEKVSMHTAWIHQCNRKTLQ